MKRVLACGDFHCGHFAGLAGPGRWMPLDGARSGIGKMQRELWGFFERKVNELGPFDAALFLGDLIDGRGERSGSTELIEVDRYQQAHMAAECIKAVPLKKNGKIVLVKGTPYHAGNQEDYEEIIADLVGTKYIGGHEWVDANGLVFDLKHKVGASQIPHGRHTAVARERLWNFLWSEKKYAPRADVILRGHVHYFGGAFGADWMGMTLPALQGPGSKFGVLQCSGTVDFGLVVFYVKENKEYDYKAHLLNIETGKPEPIKI